MGRMMQEAPDIWAMLFEQTPRILRWVFGVVTLGFFTLLSILYRWHRKDMERIESRMDRIEEQLIRIATNTGARDD